jgi:hypothetical protein
MKLLQENPAETTRDILYTISRQLANNSIPPFPQAEYETPQYAVIVNGLLFTSLSCSLIAALLAVLALQWVANYDMGLNTSSARKRALQRHMRWMGIEKWKMGEVIASLPLLIFASLFLFFVGIAKWIWYLNRAISAIVIGGIGIGFLLYSITNFISIVKLDAPFRTPVSKGFAPLFRRTLLWMKLLVITFPLELLRENKGWKSIRWTRVRDVWSKIYHGTGIPPQNFVKYEELSVKDNEETAMEGLIWLANSIEVTPTSRDLFLALIKEIIQLPGELLMREEKINQAPWESIFTELCTPYFGKTAIDEYTEEEAKTARDICKAFSMISSGINTLSLSTFCRSIMNMGPSMEAIYHLIQYRHLGNSPMSLWSAVQHGPLSLQGDNYFHFLLLNIQREWHNLPHWSEIFLCNLIRLYSDMPDDGNDLYPIPMNSLLVILDIVGRQDMVQSRPTKIAEENAIIDRYISVVRRMKDGLDAHSGDMIHQTILRQLLVHISIINFSLPSAINDLKALLELLSRIISYRPLALLDRNRDKLIRILTTMEGRDLGGNLESIMTIAQEALLQGFQYNYGTDEDPFDRWTCLILAFDEYLERGNVQSGDDHLNIISFICRDPPRRSLCTPRASIRDRLTRIKHPSIALWLMHYCPDDWRFEALAHPDFSKWDNQVVDSLHRVQVLRPNLRDSDLHIGLLRAMIIEGPFHIQQRGIQFLETDYSPYDVVQLEGDDPVYSKDPEQVIILTFSKLRFLIYLFIRDGCRYWPLQLSQEPSNTMLSGTITITWME